VIRALKAFPTLFRIGVAETLAYRAEFLVWLLTTTLPLVMLGLWSSVANEAPFEGYKSADFVAYYLSTLIVRNLSGSWVAWQISEEIRMGTMSMRLLRPIHPFFALGASHIAAIPFRTLVMLPIAIGLLLSSGASVLTTEPVQLALIAPSIAIGWLLTFSMLFAIGALAFHITKTMAIANLYFGAYVPLSGYLMPLPLMKPAWIAKIAWFTPFPSMLYTPVRLMTAHLSSDELWMMMSAQVLWAGCMVSVALLVWHTGIKRFESVGA
jgi:ABC-2 type transport system permease protein